MRQQRTISFRTIARTGFGRYPERTALGLALFIGQAFIYNAVTFGLGTFLASFYGIGDATVPAYVALFALSNFFGPVLLGRLFDTVGRKPMIAGTYIGSGIVLAALTVLFVGDTLGLWGFMALLLATFFLASVAASSAYFIGAGVMAIGGLVELFLGVRAERVRLERIARPLTAVSPSRGLQR